MPQHAQSPLENHVIVSRIKISFDPSFDPSKRLKVLIDESDIHGIQWNKTAKGQSEWTLNPVSHLWPGSVLTIHPYRHRTLKTIGRSKGETVTFNGRDILLSCHGQTGEILEHAKRYTEFEVVLFVSLAPTVHIPDVGPLEGFLDIFGDATAILENAMVAMKQVSKIHPIAEATISILLSVYTLLRNEQKFLANFRDLGVEIRETLSSLSEVQGRARVIALQDGITRTLKLITEAAEFMSEFLQQSRAERVWTAQYSTAAQVFKERLRAQRQNLIEAMTIQLVHNASSNEDRRIITSLKPAKRRPYVEGCMPGTRRDILQTIEDWLDDHGAPNIFWVKGSPGAGKSVIATTMVVELRRKARLGSDFFFTAGHASLGNPMSVWRTVSADMARADSGFRNGILKIIEDQMIDPERSDIESQFKHLIEGPLQDNKWDSSTKYPVVVLDALNECSRGPQRKVFLRTLRSWNQLKPHFKLFVTARDEVDIAATLRGICQEAVLYTGDLVTPQATSDIRLFLQRAFTDIAEKYPDTLEPTWPGAPVIDHLTKRAAGLFIWADTVVKFMESGDPSKSLKLVLEDDMGGAKSNIDGLYLKVLRTSLGADDLKSFKEIIGAILVARERLSGASLKSLLGLPKEDTSVQFILNALRPVISVASVEDKLQIAHQSFSDFLTDSNRCPQQYFIHRQKQERAIAQACLKRMNNGLKFNICGLQTSSLLNDDVTDLPELIKAHIPIDLSYACKFWASHILEASNDNPDELVEQIEIFLNEKFLYWMEVLSLVHHVPLASTALLSIARWARSIKPEISTIALDGSRFVVTFQDPISGSAPHIYLSALPFSPTSSWVSTQYLPSYRNTLSVTTGLEVHWPPRLNVINVHDKGVVSVSFSPNDLHIASCSSDGAICVWDAETGQLASGPFDTSAITITFSPDGRYIASGSLNGTVCVWDADGGIAVTEPFIGHTDRVISVAFSPLGDKVVSGSQDNTIIIWDCKAGVMLVGPLIGHTSPVQYVTFSPDGSMIASGSGDDSVRVWDATEGTNISHPFMGHGGSVCSLAFSPDNKTVVSAGSDGMIRVWEMGSGVVTRAPIEGHAYSPSSSVAFSPSGRRIVSGGRSTIHVWDVKEGKLIAGPFTGHSGVLSSVAISSDDGRIVSGSQDGTISIWDAEYRQIAIPGYRKWVPGDILSVGFSPDRKQIVTGSRKGEIQIWDAEDSSLLYGPYEGHVDEVSAVALSFDGKQIVSGSLDKTVRLWDTERGMRASDPLGAHTTGISAVAFSWDSGRVVTCSNDGEMCIFDSESGELVCGPFGGGAVAHALSFSPNGERVASGSIHGEIYFWDGENGALASGPHEGHKGRVAAIAFSPDGRLVASGSFDATLLLWNAADGTIVLGPLNGHRRMILSVTFITDGRHIVSVGNDHTARVWNVDIGSMGAPNHAGSSLESRDHIPPIFSEESELDKQGWMRGSDGSLLFWVPKPYRAGLFRPRNVEILGARVCKLDVDNFVCGTSWTACTT